jgi:hypothetical protein
MGVIDVIANQMNCKYILLNALEHVITYYDKFGYKFRLNCGRPSRGVSAQDITNLQKAFKSGDYEEQLAKMDSHLLGFYRDTIRSDTVKTRMEKLRDDGFPMIKCLDNISVSGKKTKKKSRKKSRKK